MSKDKKILTAATPAGMFDVAKSILNDFGDNRIFALYGKMGAGKTVLIQHFCKILGVEDVVNSPTFAIVNEYTTKEGEPVFHFDFYRMEKPEEAYDIGYEEYIYSGNYCFLEWPEKISELLPGTFVYISIEENETGGREVTCFLKQ
jgi:tRNA threonylcarbamoyladenosine biosynthesis protein TsaE